MEPIRTTIDAWAQKDKFAFSVEKWWMPTAALTGGATESYTAIALTHTKLNEVGEAEEVDVVCLSLAVAEKLAKQMLEICEKAKL
jgi:hypothetical protein